MSHEPYRELSSEAKGVRPRVPPITIITENLGPERSSFAGTPSPVQNAEYLQHSWRTTGYPSEGGQAYLAGPSNQVNNVTNNLLNVPSASSRHYRDQSFSSDCTAVSTWTASPYLTTPASDIEDPTIDERRLLSIDADKIENNPFAFTAKQLVKLHESRDLSILRAMGGVQGLCLGLRTDIEKGLSNDEDKFDAQITLDYVRQMLEAHQRELSKVPATAVQDLDHRPEEPLTSPTLGKSTPTLSRRATQLSLRRRPQYFQDRRRMFGENKIPSRKPKNILQLMWIALHDKVLILLCIAAVVSLALGLYQTFRPGSTTKLEWVEGVAILTAVAIATVGQSVNDYQKEQQFRKLNKKKEDISVKIIRGGRPGLVNVYDIVVGDILLLEPGDIVPVDAILVEGHNIRCDESTITGETNTIKKVPADIALEHGIAFSTKYDPFILSGSKVFEGIGKCMVTGVGVNSGFGRMMISFAEEREETPLQIRLGRIADMIAQWGVSVATILFIVLFIKFLVRLPSSNETPYEKGAHFMQILIVAVSIVVVAVPEGLPLAVTLSLAYAIVRMLRDHNLVKVLQACETMGNATTICSDKTGTLTENKMTVVSGRLGVSDTFVRISQLDGEAEANQASSMQTYFQTAAPQIMRLMLQSIAINTTAFESTDEKGNRAFVGSKTESALLYMAKDHLGMDDVATERHNANVVQYIPFSSERKWMGTVAKLEDAEGISYRLLIKGAVEIVLQRCDRVIDLSNTENLAAETLSDEHRQLVDETNTQYASRALRVMAFAYRDFPQWPPQGARVVNDDKTQAESEDVFRDMVFIGLLGIADPLRPGVTQAVADCRKAGVTVRMVTGDNVLTAKAIALECGILTPGGIVLEGPRFRGLSERELDIILPRLQVLARSSPQDKERLVRRLKHLNEIVAVTGDGTNDGPALKAADVGFSMGIAGTEVAKEASSIILMDDNFSSIVHAISWGRCINDAVKKFLQFQLTVSVVAVVITFVTAAANSDESPSISPVQLLWVNLIQDTLGALALATDPPTPQMLDRKPEPKSASMISFSMWKMIFGQSLAQITIILILRYGGEKIFTDWSGDSLDTVVFNTFVWLQFFNEINCRRIDKRLNVFAGIHRNPFFMLIMLVIIAGQILIIFVGGAAFSVTRLDGTQWLVSVLLGSLALPTGAIVRLIPDKYIQFFLPKSLYSERPRISEADEEIQPSDWNSALKRIYDDLISIKTLRNRRRLSDLGLRRKRVPRQIPTEPVQSESAPQTTEDNSLLTRTHSSRTQVELPLYSIYSPHTLVPALVASSITLPRTPTDPQPVTHNSEELIATIRGIEVYDDSRQNRQADSGPNKRVATKSDQSIKGKSTVDVHLKSPQSPGKPGETSGKLLSPTVYGTFSKKTPGE